jgi:hypothetical protein
MSVSSDLPDQHRYFLEPGCIYMPAEPTTISVDRTRRQKAAEDDLP